MASASPSLLHRFYPESQFGGFSNVDGTLVFYARVHALLTPASVVVDFGCGRGCYGEDPVLQRRSLRILRGKCARVIGLDVDETGASNPYLDEFRRLEGRWPVDDASVDLCVCDQVLEHLPDPAQFFAECFRVLKPGGCLCLRTTNVFSYVGLAARLVPGRWHSNVLRRAQADRKAEDVFPTLYRCNTRWTLRRMLTRHGFHACVQGYEAEPQYLHFSALLYWLGRLHQRHAPEMIRAALFAFARKPGAPGASEAPR